MPVIEATRLGDEPVVDEPVDDESVGDESLGDSAPTGCESVATPGARWGSGQRGATARAPVRYKAHEALLLARALRFSRSDVSGRRARSGGRPLA